jgi:hypothetical protein
MTIVPEKVENQNPFHDLSILCLIPGGGNPPNESNSKDSTPRFIPVRTRIFHYWFIHNATAAIYASLIPEAAGSTLLTEP